jgi:hypothetical protein
MIDKNEYISPNIYDPLDEYIIIMNDSGINNLQ